MGDNQRNPDCRRNDFALFGRRADPAGDCFTAHGKKIFFFSGQNRQFIFRLAGRELHHPRQQFDHRRRLFIARGYFYSKTIRQREFA